jgi:hypothetical protein
MKLLQRQISGPLVNCACESGGNDWAPLEVFRCFDTLANSREQGTKGG